jgi:hypothetical protein
VLDKNLLEYVALGAILIAMTVSRPTERTYKTAWFSKAARKAHITDQELCVAVVQVSLGQVDDLGGGVFKKRLNKNEHRAIILSKVHGFWIYEYVFAKKDRDNINEAELKAFRLLVKSYATLTAKQIAALVNEKDWIEICKETTP